jgi:hypothetical protein
MLGRPTRRLGATRRRERRSAVPLIRYLLLGILAVALWLVAFVPLEVFVFYVPPDLARWRLSAFADLGSVLLLDAGIGALVGYRLPGVWYLGALGAWPAIDIGAYNLIVGLSSPAVAQARGEAFMIAIAPVVVALAAGYGAAALARRRRPRAPP